ncbi:MAG TPA: L-threonine 3-dehydrogenase [Candidatus Tectomicrobia bacterium]|jgi:threonine 3-dehydrogenase
MNQNTMLAVVKARPQRGGELTRVAVPQCQPHEVLVRLRATSVCGTDVHIYHWDQWAQHRLTLPRILGHEAAGEVVEVGREVQGIAVGDLVSAETHIPCGHCYQCRTGKPESCQRLKILGIDTDGAFAEYVALPEIDVWKNDPVIPLECTAIQEPLGNAIDTVLAEDVAGKTVLVTGCGPIGLLAIGIARAAGATSIFATEVSPFRRQLATRMGATQVWNPLEVDVVEAVREMTDGKGADVLLEMSGKAQALQHGLQALTQGGRVSLLGLFARPVSLDLSTQVILKDVRLYGITGRHMFATWYKAARFLKAGRLDPSPILTHRLPLCAFDQAMELITQGECGKVILLP